MNYKIERVVVGNLQENCYVVTIDNKTYLIDPGDEAEKIEKHLKDKNVVAILVTHHHFDHIGALEYFEKKYNLKHNSYEYNNFKIIKCPGHTDDSVSYYFEKIKCMFCGDFIFLDNIGRMDLPGGSIKKMQESLNNISTYPDEIILYPGHGDKTSLGYEKRHFKYYF